MPISTHTLSFRLRIARTRADLLAACQVRADSYGRHLPHLRPVFEVPDTLDLRPDTTVFLCVDKATNQPVGTARVQINTHGPLLIEESVSVPPSMRDEARVEITRLAVATGADPLVKLALMKAMYLYCMAAQVRWMVIGARSEALIRQYRRLGFADMHEDGRQVPLKHAGHVPHSVLNFDLTTARRCWLASRHPMYDFTFDSAHRDIELFTMAPALDVQAQPMEELEALAA